MSDPIAEVVGLLQPSAPFTKQVSAAGAWRVRRSEAGRPFYCVVLEGGCRLEVEGRALLELQAGDFVLIPSARRFAMSSLEPVAADDIDPATIVIRDGRVRLGQQHGMPDWEALLGYCVFGSPDAALLTSLLPQLIHVRGEQRLLTLVQLLRDESRADRPARELILKHLLEVILLEAFRADTGTDAPPGLLRGLADDRLAVALRSMHQHPGKAWTVALLADVAALSRSVFFERFKRALGVAPMHYLLAWRIALAKKLLQETDIGIAQLAERLGYGSATAFSVAFSRHTGMSPTQYAQRKASILPGFKDRKSVV